MTHIQTHQNSIFMRIAECLMFVAHTSQSDVSVFGDAKPNVRSLFIKKNDQITNTKHKRMMKLEFNSIIINWKKSNLNISEWKCKYFVDCNGIKKWRKHHFIICFQPALNHCVKSTIYASERNTRSEQYTHFAYSIESFIRNSNKYEVNKWRLMTSNDGALYFPKTIWMKFAFDFEFCSKRNQRMTKKWKSFSKIRTNQKNTAKSQIHLLPRRTTRQIKYKFFIEHLLKQTFFMRLTAIRLPIFPKPMKPIFAAAELDMHLAAVCAKFTLYLIVQRFHFVIAVDNSLCAILFVCCFYFLFLF